MRGRSKKIPKAEESELGEVPTTWAEGMATWEGSVSHTRGVKLGMPPTLLPGQDGRNMLALSVRGRVGKINIRLLQ